jgi:hypothetical protein
MNVRAPSIALILTIGLLAVAGRSSAQEAPLSQFEHIKGLEPFVGFWQSDTPEEEGGPATLVCRLIANRSYLQMQLSMQVEGERETIATMLIGKDHAKDQVAFWGFWADQQTMGKNVEVGEGTAKWSETGEMPGGGKSSADVVIKASGDEMTVDVSNVKKAGEDQPEMHITFKRSQRRGRGGQ